MEILLISGEQVTKWNDLSQRDFINKGNFTS
jgi:hypothetical protein